MGRRILMSLRGLGCRGTWRSRFVARRLEGLSDEPRPGAPQKLTHDYVRHGTTSLFAALDMATGRVIGQTQRQHRHQEFLRFLKTIDKATPSGLDLHLILDNYATHKTPQIQQWLVRHPRFHLHFTPTYSSWLNLVERWFGELTNRK